jgi:hypothetical protein
VKASRRSLRSETIKHLILSAISDVSSAMNDLNGHYIDSEAVVSDHSQCERVFGVHQVNT